MPSKTTLKHFSTGNTQTTMSVPDALIEEAKKEAERLTATGMRAQYTDVLRMAMTRGMPLVLRGSK